MSKDWDYAKLSALAKENGGPENLVNTLVESGKNQMKPYVAVAFAAGVLGAIAVIKVVAYLREKKKQSAQEVEAAKQELIRGIKEYDKSQQIETEDKKTDDTENGQK